jgi:CRISPR-associated protein Csm2
MKIPILDEDGRKKGELSFEDVWVKTSTGLPKEAVKYAEMFGKYLVDPYFKNGETRPGKNALTTNQLRNFFGEIRRIQMKGFERNKTEFLMLKPKLAYATARADRNNRIKEFKEVLTKMIDEVIETENPKHFENFVNFVEATVAYHKANGGN